MSDSDVIVLGGSDSDPELAEGETTTTPYPSAAPPAEAPSPVINLLSDEEEGDGDGGALTELLAATMHPARLTRALRRLLRAGDLPGGDTAERDGRQHACRAPHKGQQRHRSVQDGRGAQEEEPARRRHHLRTAKRVDEPAEQRGRQAGVAQELGGRRGAAEDPPWRGGFPPPLPAVLFEGGGSRADRSDDAEEQAQPGGGAAPAAGEGGGGGAKRRRRSSKQGGAASAAANKMDIFSLLRAAGRGEHAQYVCNDATLRKKLLDYVTGIYTAVSKGVAPEEETVVSLSGHSYPKLLFLTEHTPAVLAALKTLEMDSL